MGHDIHFPLTFEVSETFEASETTINLQSIFTHIFWTFLFESALQT